MSTQAGAATIGSLGGAWSFPLHGSEFDGVVNPFIKTMGSTGTFASFIFLALFFSVYVRISHANKNIKKNKHEVKSDQDIYFEDLSKGVQKAWLGMRWLSFFAFLFGFLNLLTTSLINEGFVTGKGGAGTALIVSTMIFSLGGTALTLGFIIAYLILQWPATKSPKGGKSKKETKEDSKLYNAVPPNMVTGVIMSIFFLLPIITILVTEFDEGADVRQVVGQAAV